MTFKIGFYRLQTVDIFSIEINIVVTDVVNDVTYSRKSVITRWSYDFYYMTLSTGKQRRHMIIPIIFFKINMLHVD